MTCKNVTGYIAKTPDRVPLQRRVALPVIGQTRDNGTENVVLPVKEQNGG